LYAGDVGQNLWEEVDIINSGGNYGWRIFEGNVCTMIDPCVSTGLTFPILVYGHTVGRCAILGGYVYRGTLNTIAQGLYTYGDLCTGEIFTFDGTNQVVLTNLGAEISSFGQDESGELYVCGITAGTVTKIEPSNPCVMSLGSQTASFAASGGTGSFMVNDPGGCSWSSFSNASWISVTSGGTGSTTGTLMFSVAANTAPGPRLGTISVAGTAFKITQSGTTPSFVGFVDHMGCDSIGGWAADRNALNTSINVEIFDGTTLISTVLAANSRPDVGSFLGDNGLHGFSIPTPASLKDGAAHSVHVKFETSATELTNSPAMLTCGTSMMPNYIGFVDHAGCDNIRGWAADRNRLNTAINVEVFDGANLISTVLANGSRPDVGTFLGDNGLHGFVIPTPAVLMDGASHSVHVKFEGSTTELNGSPATLMCTMVAPNYAGNLDHVGCDTIGGWMADRNRLNISINAEIFDGTTLIAIVPANISRPDVGAFLGDNGFHGFSITTPAALKTGAAHNIHVNFEASSVQLGGSPATISCTASTASYVGFVDHMGCDSIAGWVADRNRLNTPITV
ncbi:MAG: BACON domain-containing protein, partial [Blastocatellia bacterium]